MDDVVCRAVTFINYNIPIRDGSNIWNGFAEYYTTGFFDRMYTKRVDCNYTERQLKELWDYGIECIAKGDGTFAHQNVYCFSKDEWNDDITDRQFWSREEHEEMLLTFVIFVQTSEYMKDDRGLERQCRKFNEAARGQLQGDGYVYTYGTVDKNDFVICIRSKNYKKTVNAIMKLHEAGCSVVYSYSVFGISKERQMRITDEEYTRLNEQKIDSISLKGVTNSTKWQGGPVYTLDEKYVRFCKKLVGELYIGEKYKQGKEPDFKIYDILGDNDFRLIARTVPLGNLIRQIGKEGLLDYEGNATQYTFYSTHLVLNTRDEDRQSQLQQLDNDSVSEENSQLKEHCYKTKHCEKLKSEMDAVNQKLKTGQGRSRGNEKLIAAFHGVYQLIQSLTALEAAPTKKYDFLSLYYPMETLISILGKKTTDAEMTEELAENDCLYDFIHKISMTLHGTLRTDIQFFQIRDFNATVHYAPAKLRAYYSFFVFMLSAHIREVSSEKNKHSYIFSPGMFKTIFVQQLFENPDEKERLMLITVPERYLYFPKNLSIILAHEVGHLIGDDIRKRKDRHTAILNCSYRTLCLEITKYVDSVLPDEMSVIMKRAYRTELMFDDEEFLKLLLRCDEQEAQKAKDSDHIYYSTKSLERIQKVYRAAEIDFGYRTWNEYCCRLKTVYQTHVNPMRGKKYPDLAKEARDNHLFYEKLVGDLVSFFTMFKIAVLPGILTIFHYLMSETVSDLLAILVLGLTPMEYINSLADEVRTTKEKQEIDNGITKVRIDLVVSAAQKLNEEFPWKGQLSCQLDQWDNVYESLIPQLDKASEVFIMAAGAYIYRRSRSNKMESIEEYKSTFNQKEQAFKEYVYDFLNDQLVHQYMCDYLVECGREYIKRLRENPRYIYSRRIVSEAFRNCTDKSPIDLLYQVDAFLSDFEEDWKNKYF